MSSTDDVVRRLRGEEREATAAARVTGVEDEDVVERPRAGGAPRRGRELRAVAVASERKKKLGFRMRAAAVASGGE